jgi:ATP-dependent Clp protease ATP-binding subunit ClpB
MNNILDEFSSGIGENDLAHRDEEKDGKSSIKTEKKGSDDEKKLTIEYFGSDLTRESKEGFLDPVIGRNKEIEQIIYTLMRKTKNNPLLIGEAGVGKTAVVE